MDVIKKLESALDDLKKIHYVVKDIPIQFSELDLKINEIIGYCIGSNQDVQDRIRKAVTVEIAWLLLCFGIRMATYSLRLSNQKYFTNGLFAIGMTLGILDRRELLLILPLYYDVHKKNNLSYNEIFKQNKSFTSVLKEYINRDEKDKSLESMGYVIEVDKNNNPTYQRTW